MGTSTFRALPPLVKPGRVRPARVKSSQGRGRDGARRRGRASRGSGRAHRAGQAKSSRARVVPLGTRRYPASEERLSVGGRAGVQSTHPPCVTSGKASHTHAHKSACRKKPKSSRQSARAKLNYMRISSQIHNNPCVVRSRRRCRPPRRHLLPGRSSSATAVTAVVRLTWRVAT